jgi:hypothetical protein
MALITYSQLAGHTADGSVATAASRSARPTTD